MAVDGKRCWKESIYIYIYIYNIWVSTLWNVDIYNNWFCTACDPWKRFHFSVSLVQEMNFTIHPFYLAQFCLWIRIHFLSFSSGLGPTHNVVIAINHNTITTIQLNIISRVVPIEVLYISNFEDEIRLMRSHYELRIVSATITSTM